MCSQLNAGPAECDNDTLLLTLRGLTGTQARSLTEVSGPYLLARTGISLKIVSDPGQHRDR